MTDIGTSTPGNPDESAEQFPLRLRVHALARMLGLTSRDVLKHLEEMGVTARSAQSSVGRADAEAVAARIAEPATGADAAPAQAEAVASEPAQAVVSSPVNPLFSAAGTEQHEPVKVAEAEPVAPLFLPPSEAAVEVVRAEKPVRTEAAPEVAAPAADGDEAAVVPESASDETARDEADDEESKGDDSDGEDSDDRPRRRRRGRRGRGRGRGDQNADADDSTDGDAADRGASADDDAEGDDGSGDAAGQAADGGTEGEPVAETGADGGDTGGDDTGSGDASGAADSEGDGGDTADSEGEAAAGDAEPEARERPSRRRRNRRGRRNGGADAAPAAQTESDADDQDTPDQAAADDDQSETDEDESDDATPSSKRRRRRRRRKGGGDGEDGSSDDPPNTVVHEREPRSKRVRDEVQGISGSTRLEAKRQRRRDGRDASRRRPPILSESEFLARRESVERVMVVRERNAMTVAPDGHSGPIEDYTQVAVLEDGVLVEHFVTTETSQSMVGNIYLGRVQNVLPGMEAAFVDIGRGRNGVLYAGEVNWEAAGLGGGARKIEQALRPGDYVVVQVSKDPVGHKGARLTTQISLAGRYLVYVPEGTSTGISRKLPDTERKRLKSILSKVVPENAGVIVRTASEGVAADELAADIDRLESKWKAIETQAAEHRAKASGTTRALYEEPDLLVRVVRDLFNEDFTKLVVEGEKAWDLVAGYVHDVAPDLFERVERFEKSRGDSPDSFIVYRIDEQLAKALDRKVWLPSGGTLIIEHTEAMTVVDVNTGKFTGSGSNLEETVTRNNLEAAEEIVRQMRLRDIGGMIIVDFIDMVLESNRDLVLRRLTEALARDRTRHQVSEVTSLGLVQMTRKRLGTGLLEAFSTTCTTCSGRGLIVHSSPVEIRPSEDSGRGGDAGSRRSRKSKNKKNDAPEVQPETKPAHKPAAEHPLFRAMAGGHSEADGHPAEGPAERDVVVVGDEVVVTEVVAVTETVEVAPVVPVDVPEASEPDSAAAPATAAEPVVAVAAESVVAVGAEPRAAAAVAESAEPKAKPRRRRAVRRAASAPAAAPAPEPVVAQAPVTTVAAPQTEVVVAVTRKPRRRAVRRSAGSSGNE